MIVLCMHQAYILSSIQLFYYCLSNRVIRCMLQKPIMSGRISKWAHALIEHDLVYESLKSMKVKVVTDLLQNMGLMILANQIYYILLLLPGRSTLVYQFAMKDKIGIMLVQPRGATFDFSSQLRSYCTINQAEYEALLFKLDLLDYVGVKHLKVLGVNVQMVL